MQFTNISSGPKGLNTTLGPITLTAGQVANNIDVFLQEKATIDSLGWFSYTGSFTANPPTAQATALAGASVDVIEEVGGTTYTIVAADNGKVKAFTSATAVTVTLPSTIPAGFNVLWRVVGAGQVTFSAGAGSTLRNASSHTKSAAQYAEGSLSVHSQGEWYLSGSTAA
jgi:hypothetical protein